MGSIQKQLLPDGTLTVDQQSGYFTVKATENSCKGLTLYHTTPTLNDPNFEIIERKEAKSGICVLCQRDLTEMLKMAFNPHNA